MFGAYALRMQDLGLSRVVLETSCVCMYEILMALRIEPQQSIFHWMRHLYHLTSNVKFLFHRSSLQWEPRRIGWIKRWTRCRHAPSFSGNPKSPWQFSRRWNIKSYHVCHGRLKSVTLDMNHFDNASQMIRQYGDGTYLGNSVVHACLWKK